MVITEQKILADIKHSVLSVDNTADIILFGSRARGDFNEESDWDILILSSKQVDSSYKTIIRNSLLPLQLEYETSINYIIKSKKYYNDYSFVPLFQEIKKDGRPF